MLQRKKEKRERNEIEYKDIFIKENKKPEIQKVEIQRKKEDRQPSHEAEWCVLKLELLVKLFVPNSFTKSSNFKTHHSASCDGCRSSFYSSPRYICLTCKPGIYLTGGYSDFCYICIESMMRNDEKAKKIKQKSDPISYNYSTFCRNHQLIDNHDHENHIYLMVALEGILSSYQGF